MGSFRVYKNHIMSSSKGIGKWSTTFKVFLKGHENETCGLVLFKKIVPIERVW